MAGRRIRLQSAVDGLMKWKLFRRGLDDREAGQMIGLYAGDLGGKSDIYVDERV